MKVLMIGGGGREHALIWKLSQSPLVEEIHVAPGNAGMKRLAVTHNISSTDKDGLLELCKRIGPGLVVIGPEAPLVAGISDLIEGQGFKVFGPSEKAAELEGSKAFAKRLCLENGIPTAGAEFFSDYESARKYVLSRKAPIVVKADGLAAGKGVTVAQNTEEALKSLDDIMLKKRFGSAGDMVLIEECLSGYELSLLALCDGTKAFSLEPAQDYKRIGNGDNGPNTGGMGSYSPVPALNPEMYKRATEEIISPTIEAMQRMGIPYKGVLYAGLMITEEGPKVLEFNVRFGDPETQAILPRFESDLADIMLKCVDGKMSSASVNWNSKPCVCTVLASHGYPGKFEKGKIIRGIEDAECIEGVAVFHAGTAFEGIDFVTSGGRVLNVSGVGNSFSDAREKVYDAIECIQFEGKYFRTDIAERAAI